MRRRAGIAVAVIAGVAVGAPSEAMPRTMASRSVPYVQARCRVTADVPFEAHRGLVAAASMICERPTFAPLVLVLQQWHLAGDGGAVAHWEQATLAANRLRVRAHHRVALQPAGLACVTGRFRTEVVRVGNGPLARRILATSAAANVSC